MKDIKTKREREKAIVSEMIALNGRKRHKTKKGQPCAKCTELTEYAKQRSDNCPFMENKTFCSNCKVHCYKPEMSEKIRAVMRFFFFIMFFRHPVTAVLHVIVVFSEFISGLKITSLVLSTLPFIVSYN